MTNTSWLPRFLRWIFAVFTVLMIVGAVAIVLVLVIDPKLQPDMQFGPFEVNIEGQPGTFAMRDSTFVAAMFHGNVSVRVDNAGGLLETLKHYGLPLALLNVIFFAALFDLLRRLFRNVGRGESFTQQSLRLVQIIGVSLLVFSLVSAIAEGWFHYALFSYIAQHAVLTISGTPIRLPHPHELTISSGDGFPFGSPYFFSGLLVLALSEVFRQGLVLKRENDLTV